MLVLIVLVRLLDPIPHRHHQMIFSTYLQLVVLLASLLYHPHHQVLEVEEGVAEEPHLTQGAEEELHPIQEGEEVHHLTQAEEAEDHHKEVEEELLLRRNLFVVAEVVGQKV